jgi:hypothetical protein
MIWGKRLWRALDTLHEEWGKYGDIQQHLLKVMQNQLKISNTSRTLLKGFSFTAEGGEGYEVGGDHKIGVIKPCNVWILQFQPS